MCAPMLRQSSSKSCSFLLSFQCRLIDEYQVVFPNSRRSSRFLLSQPQSTRTFSSNLLALSKTWHRVTSARWKSCVEVGVRSQFRSASCDIWQTISFPQCPRMGARISQVSGRCMILHLWCARIISLVPGRYSVWPWTGRSQTPSLC